MPLEEPQRMAMSWFCVSFSDCPCEGQAVWEAQEAAGTRLSLSLLPSDSSQRKRYSEAWRICNKKNNRVLINQRIFHNLHDKKAQAAHILFPVCVMTRVKSVRLLSCHAWKFWQKFVVHIVGISLRSSTLDLIHNGARSNSFPVRFYIPLRCAINPLGPR